MGVGYRVELVEKYSSGFKEWSVGKYLDLR